MGHDIGTTVRSIFILFGVGIVYHSTPNFVLFPGKASLVAAMSLDAVAVVCTRNVVLLEGLDKILVSTAFLQFVPVCLSLLPLTPLAVRDVKWNSRDHGGRTTSNI